MAKSYYTILGITSDASQTDVKTAYRRLAKEFHPDRYTGTDGPFLEVQEAYSVLGDSGRRREYDEGLSRIPPHAPTRPRRATAPEPLTRPHWSEARRPEPLIPQDRPMDMGEISPVQAFRAFTPSFADIFDRLWGNTVLFRPNNR